MARTVLTKSAAPGSYPTAGVTVTFTAVDTGNANQFVFTGNEMLVVRNVHATDPFTVTITSAANARHRTKDITTETIVAGASKIYGPFRNKSGWAQADGSFWLTGSDASIEVAVITLP